MTAGERIDNYELLERIGEGGMGDVFRARDLALERLVAIKFLKPALASDGKLVERFRTEAKTMAQLQHPNITQLYKLIEDDDQFAMVMEFVEGETLEAAIRRDGARSFESAAPLFLQCLDAFDCAHRFGIVHRDIKPANVMICGANRIKVMDFGVARIVGSDRQTLAGHLVGTPQFMAPEQITGGDVDWRSDIYCLGALLYQMLTGRAPFEGPTEFAIMRAQVEDTPPAPSLCSPGVPPAIDSVVRRAMAKSPRDRYQSAAEFREDVARCLQNFQLTKPGALELTGMLRTPPPPAPPPEPRVRSNPWVWVSAALAIAAIAAGVYGVQAYRVLQPERPTPSQAALAICPVPAPEPPFEMPSGAPLNKAEVILLLQARTPAERMSQIIEKRGVDFLNSPDHASDIRRVGGTHELNGIITLHHRPPVPPVSPEPVKPTVLPARPAFPQPVPPQVQLKP